MLTVKACVIMSRLERLCVDVTGRANEAIDLSSNNMTPAS